MRLKKMEITGFKSFVEKVVIDFPPGVSAIVGPNGCGKSNIVDALRWAMGEQSVKQLRGKAMEDVIFAGTDDKAALNMAEVSLVLANDGQGPEGAGVEALKDFTELMITRRLFRSGESAYLLNRHPCRLKDIQNIFLGSGLGARSYSVIGQGNIGAITDAGPDERRFFIEEAAGVTRYKSRKTETLRKLEATNSNLDRINDIVAEVARQLNGLQRQAKKAETYKTLQARIRILDLNLSIRQYDNFSGLIQKADSDLRKFKENERNLNGQFQEMEKVIQKIKAARFQKDQEIAQRQSDLHDAQRRIDKTENDLAHLRDDVVRLNDEMARLKTDREMLLEKNRSLEDDIAQVAAETADLEQQAADLKAGAEQEETGGQTIKSALEAAQKDLTRRKSDMDALLQQETRHQAALDNAQQNMANLDRRRKRADEEALVAKREAMEAEQRESVAREEMEDCREAKADLDDRLADLDADLDARQAELAEQVQQIQVLDLERNKVQSRYSALKKMADTYEWYREGVKAVMTREQGRPPAGVLGLTADILEPAPGYETAVEAVLGETLQYVLVQTPDVGAESMAYLRSGNNGRSGFIPLSSVRPSGKGALASTNGHPRLLDHVHVREGCEVVGESLLGNVLITDKLEDALDLARSDHAAPAVATRGGDVITSQGILLGGSPDTLAGILAKKQELKTLAREIADLDDSLTAERKNQAEMEDAFEAIKEDRRALADDRQAALEDELSAQKAVYQAEETLKQARRRLEAAAGEDEQFADEADDLAETAARSQAALAALSRDLAAAGEAISKKEADIAALSDQLSAFNDRTVDIRMKLTTVKTQLDNSRNTMKRLQSFLKDGAARVEHNKQDMAEKEKQLAESNKRIKAESHQLTVLRANLDHLNQGLETSKAALEAINSDLQKKDTALADVRQNINNVREEIRSLEMAQSQQRMQADAIQARLLERYHGGVDELRPEMADASLETTDDATIETELAQCRKKLAAIGDVNMGAIREYEELKERHDFLTAQQKDLFKAVEDLHQVIHQINTITQEKFLATFNQVNEKLNEVFPRLFGGGSARLELTEPNKPLETGVEFMVHPPGKKLTRLSLLSGGEKALSAIAFVFSIFLIKPASFCIMDEIDAPLDDANVHRFNELLKLIGETSQIVMITHKKKSMEFADTLFGVTMEKKGISKVVSVNLEGR